MSCYRRTRKDIEGKPYEEEIYTADFVVNKKRYVLSTGQTLKAEAEKIEAKLKKELKAGRIPDLIAALKQRQAPATLATIKQLCDSYEYAPLENSLVTRRDNIQALHLMLKKTGLPPADDTTSTSILTPQLIRDYFRAVTRDCEALGQEETNSRKRTANGLTTRVLSMFTPAARAWYEDNKLQLPDLDALVKAAKASEFKRIPKKDYNPPEDAIIEKTLASWADLQDRNMFLAVGLSLAFGLRKGEIAQVRRNWFTISSGRPTLTNPPNTGAFKNKSGLVRICALDPFWTTLKTIAATRFNLDLLAKDEKTAQDYLLDGHNTERTSSCFDRVSIWMRDLGWDMQKTNHALRGYAGSMIAVKFNIWEASVWLRHQTVKVTEEHYTSFVSHAAMIDKDKLPISWALAPTKDFEPTIVKAVAS